MVAAPLEARQDQSLERFDGVVLVAAAPNGPSDLVVALPDADAHRLLGLMTTAPIYATLPMAIRVPRLNRHPQIEP